MYRRTIDPRPDWPAKVEAVGLNYHTIDNEIYWDESACYRFTTAEIDRLEQATAELYSLCCAAAEAAIRAGRLAELGIPEQYRDYIVRSWEDDEPSLYGRFDLSFDGSGPPKLLEFNADTPTALPEAAVVQWFWLQERFPDADQFNSIHEKLIESWRTWPRRPELLHFAAATESPEDLGNLEYLRDTAIQAGMATGRLDIDEIGWDSANNRFVDLDNQPITDLFKLYPWEWLLAEKFGPNLKAGGIRLIEPPWKLLLSNKGILPLLWELFPDHPNLLPAYFEPDRLTGDRVIKPLYSREGANIRIIRNGETVWTGGTYGGGREIVQQYQPLPCFAGNYPVLGSWIIGGEPAGIGIREDRSPITSNTSRFIPHYFTED